MAKAATKLNSHAAAGRSHSRTTVKLVTALLLVCIGTAPQARADGGPLGIDHRLSYDNSGIWARSNQNALIAVLLAGEIGGALWEGGEDRFGRTLWRSIDATAIGGVSSEVLKRVFSRERPSETSDPNQWFKGGGHQSFPSGEVTVVIAGAPPRARRVDDATLDERIRAARAAGESAAGIAATTDTRIAAAAGFCAATAGDTTGASGPSTSASIRIASE